MAKKKIEEASKYRFMCVKKKNGNYTKEFESKDEALQYANELDDKDIEWYGIYEVSPYSPYLNTIVSKRLIPHDLCYIVPSNNKPSTESKVKRSRSSKNK